MRGTLPAALALVAATALLAPATGRTQPSPAVRGRADAFVGGELERYLRYLQTTGDVAPSPWSLRSLAPRELDALLPAARAHPWADRFDFAPRTAATTVELIPPTVSVRYNSAFPYGFNDGPVWAGRGATTAAQLGVAARWRAVSLTLAPIVFRAENAAFALQQNGLAGDLAYASGILPTEVDRPQRYGSAAYTAVDPGQSTLRVDGYGLAAGLSTANEVWGPASEFPFLLGTNAAGIPRLIAGTSEPVNLWVARLHARLLWGRPATTRYTTITGRARRRLTTGFAAVLLPRGVPGLELGVGRFSHAQWPSGGLRLSDVRRPLDGLLGGVLQKDAGTDSVQENQLASVFFRWAQARSGFELYGEFGRDDQTADTRDFLVEPDHASSAMIGVRKAWRRPSGRLVAARAEILDLQAPTIGRNRGEGFAYTNISVRQGHTHLGQLLGAPVGVGSVAGATAAAELYHPRGRWTLSWARLLTQHAMAYENTGVVNPRDTDVQHALGVEALVFGRRVDVTGGLTGVYEFNRYLREDAFNLNAVAAVRYAFR